MNTAHLNVFSQSVGVGGLLPFAYYKFDSNANDSIGTNNGTASSITYVNDANLAGLSASLTISTSYIDVPDSPEFSFTNGVNDLPFTIAFSYKCNKISGNQFFVSKRILSGSDEWQIIYSAGAFKITLIDPLGAGVGYVESSYSLPLVLGNYYHITATYNGSGLASGLKIYVNDIDGGVAITSGTYTGMSNTIAQVRIGQSGWVVGSNTVVGLMDSLAFYNTEATPTEVTEIYNKLINKIELG